MHNPQYLALSRNNIYYFRFPIPPALHPCHKPSDIKLSLGTRCPRQALRLARGLSYLSGRLMENLVVQGMTYKEIKPILFNHFNELRDQIKLKISDTGPLSDEERFSFVTAQTDAAKAWDQKTYSLIATDEQLSKVIEQNNLAITKGSADYATLQREYVRHYKSYSGSVLEYNSRLEDVNFTTDPVVLAAQKQARKRKHKNLVDALNEYIEVRQKSGWQSKTVQDRRAQLNLLLDYWGQDKSVHISSDDANEFYQILIKLPKNYRVIPDLKGLTLKELAASKGHDLMSYQNVLKYLSTCSSFCDWCVKRHFTDENNFKSLIERPKGNGKQVRDAFNQDQKEKILQELLKKDSALVRKQYQKWGPLLAYYTGARLNEIAQLRVCDIITEEEVLCFSFTDEGEEQKLKNEHSKRVVPVHSKLIEHGLLQLIQDAKTQGKERLLHELTFHHKNGYGRNLGRWFNEVFLPKLDIKTGRLVFHSFRHTVSTNLQRAGVEDSLIKRLIGHAQGDMLNKVYAKGQSMKQLQEAIERL